MQFDLNKIPPILSHLKIISPNMFKTLSNEIMIHCPFCDDSTRKNSSNHGHLYLSIQFPVFNCFRCNTSGTLISLLLQTGFEDRDVINFISQFVKISFTKDYYKLKDQSDLVDKIFEIRKKLFEQNLRFKKEHKKEFEIYIEYLSKKIGLVNYINFLLFPNIHQNYVTCNFNNYSGETVLLRYLNNPKKRYMINPKTSNLYYFQRIDLNKRYNEITFCEGPFDAISLYLYNDYFKNNLFISINGKNYIGVIEKFLIQYMLIGNYKIHIVFDNDYVKNSFRILKNLKSMIEIYNGEIQIEMHKPFSKFGDVCDFPAVERIIERKK